MCGIAGYYWLNQSAAPVAGELMRMNEMLSHRGPDAGNVFEEDRVGLAHRRLSIIDLSAHANQPFFSGNERYITVYNGEVYNFQDLSGHLRSKMRTTSDTEVVTELYAEAGDAMCTDLDGMFALAIYDRERKRLFLARDFAGIKPLYYFFDGNLFAFASEIKALKALPYIRRQLEPDMNAISSFLHMGYVPKPRSAYKQIKKFPSGAYLYIDQDTKLPDFVRFRVAEDLFEQRPLIHFAEAKQELKRLLEVSVSNRLIADVPVGSFLSGGVDSGIITAMAARFIGKKLKTFSIGFEDSKYNEAHFAAQIAKKTGTDHHEFILKEKAAIDLFNDIFEAYDEPFADASSIPTMLVSKLTAEHVKVALSGDGGDELFHGYGSYNWAERMNNHWVKSFRKPIHYTLSGMPSQRYKRAAGLFDFKAGENLESHIFSQEYYFFSLAEIRQMLLDYKKPVRLNRTLPNRKLTAAEKQALFDFRYYLKDDLLVKVDRASMRYGLELRVPFLDNKLIEFAFNLDASLKVKKGVSKYLLKEVLFDYIPKSYYNRPKWGFSIPLARWLKNEMAPLIETYLNDTIVKETGLVHPHEVENLVKRFRAGQDYLYNRVWQLILLHKWWKEHRL